MAYQMDFFAGIEEKVLASIGNKVNYPAYVFVRDNAESQTGRLAFVDQNNVLKFIRGENKSQVVNVPALPQVSEGDVDVLYIIGDIVYLFNGTEYKPLGKDHTAELEALTERVVELEEKVEVLEGIEHPTVDISGLEEKVEELQAKVTDVEDQVNVLDEKSKHSYRKVEYEITDTPLGTLVNYDEKEIRVMCPTNAVFTKQAVGAEGDANSYYVTLKTYVPNDDVVGYIEHLGDLVDSEILTDLKTDEYGRRYQPTWLAVAKYDDTTGSWNYYGANSSKERYIGWDYRIDWYNADGVMIASDSIRINLSNEECHYNTEPYYLVALKADIEALKAENASIIERLDVVTEQMTEFEDRIVEVEKSTLTFVELE